MEMKDLDDLLAGAGAEADALNHHRLDPGHLLLVALGTDGGSASMQALAASGITYETFREQFSRLVADEGGRSHGSPGLEPTPATYMCLGQAQAMAAARGQTPQTDDLVLGLISVGVDPVAALLIQMA
jgi:ATP-dependent Clp protease ATP-binding subunit ClpA